MSILSNEQQMHDMEIDVVSLSKVVAEKAEHIRNLTMTFKSELRVENLVMKAYLLSLRHCMISQPYGVNSHGSTREDGNGLVPTIQPSAISIKAPQESDVVIQKNGEPFNLMRNIPIEAEEIEAIMNS